MTAYISCTYSVHTLAFLYFSKILTTAMTGSIHHSVASFSFSFNFVSSLFWIYWRLDSNFHLYACDFSFFFFNFISYCLANSAYIHIPFSQTWRNSVKMTHYKERWFTRDESFVLVNIRWPVTYPPLRVYTLYTFQCHCLHDFRGSNHEWMMHVYFFITVHALADS